MRKKRVYVPSDEIKLFRKRIGGHLADNKGDLRQTEDADDAMVRQSLDLHGA